MAKASTGGNKVVQYWGTGRRKTSVARVRLVPGQGKVMINERTVEDYLGGRTLLASDIQIPLKATQNEGRYDVLVNVA
ncbi:MAG: 30S ribosomal protein S9, partial [Cyanobacteria bacterium REEB65]|nr:30S ribosomal protein S9 [Cyanobacteria bacterium REEB65]